MVIDDFIGKSIAVVGASVEGYESAKYLLSKKLSVTVCDQRNSHELAKIIEQLKPRGALFCLGEKYLSHIEDYDIIIRTPGMPLWHPRLIQVLEKGALITSQTRIFFDLCPCPIIGVTGTKGKGTTASLIAEILRKGGKDVQLGGNIGLPPFTFLDALIPTSWVVLELSSFQLEDLQKSPHIAVLLMITQEHLASSSRENPNFHRSLSEYLVSKQQIVCYQGKGDFAIINADYERSLAYLKKTPAKVFLFSRKHTVDCGAYLDDTLIKIRIDKGGSVLCDTKGAQLIGQHNRENMMAAALAAIAVGIDKNTIAETLLTFPGLPHRLEFVREVGGVRYFNDSFATTPESTIAAVRSFHEPITLILGGSDKGSDYSDLAEVIADSSVKNIILIGKMADKIQLAVVESGFEGKLVVGGENMKVIVTQAFNLACENEIVLLSPACASFDMFANYKERGRKFCDEVSAI